MADFPRAHKTIVTHEVGRPGATGLVDNPNDPGGGQGLCITQDAGMTQPC